MPGDTSARMVSRERLAMIFLYNYRSMWTAFEKESPTSDNRRYFGVYFMIIDKALRELEQSPPERYKRQRCPADLDGRMFKVYRDILYYEFIDPKIRATEEIMEILKLTVAKSTYIHYRAVAIDVFSDIVRKHYVEYSNALRKE